MAEQEKSESFFNAVIDVEDMSITEFGDDETRVYSLSEFLKRWSGIVGVTLTICRVLPTIPDGEV